MRMELELTTEPFVGEGPPPPHATEVVRAAREAGLDCDFGPLGTTVSGDETVLVPLVGELVSTAFANGATRVTLQVGAAGDVGLARAEAAPADLPSLLAAVAAEMGGSLADLDRAGKQRAVRVLEERGAFSYRKSPEIVAEALGVSRFTVYNYLNRERG